MIMAGRSPGHFLWGDCLRAAATAASLPQETTRQHAHNARFLAAILRQPGSSGFFGNGPDSAALCQIETAGAVLP